MQLLTNFSIFGEIKLKFSGGVNSKTLISYFVSIFPKEEFNKENGFFMLIFARPLSNKSVAMVI